MLLPDDQLQVASYKFKVQLGPEPAAGQPDERTEHLDAEEVADLLRQAKHNPLHDSAGEVVPPRALQPNPLPDVYPADQPKK